jgi:hypothetical protein
MDINLRHQKENNFKPIASPHGHHRRQKTEFQAHSSRNIAKALTSEMLPRLDVQSPRSRVNDDLVDLVLTPKIKSTKSSQRTRR